MTERFTLTNPKNAFQEMKCGIDDRGNTLTFNEVVDMLNAFNDENEQLKSEIEKLSYANDDLLEEKRIWKQMSDEYTKLSDENEKLKSICQDHRDHAIDFKADCVRLEKENEQLKKELSNIDGQLLMLDNCDNWDYDRMKHTVREIAEIIGYNGTINPKKGDVE